MISRLWWTILHFCELKTHFIPRDIFCFPKISIFEHFLYNSIFIPVFFHLLEPCASTDGSCKFPINHPFKDLFSQVFHRAIIRFGKLLFIRSLKVRFFLKTPQKCDSRERKTEFSLARLGKVGRKSLRQTLLINLRKYSEFVSPGLKLREIMWI